MERGFRLDFLVDGDVIVEVKCVELPGAGGHWFPLRKSRCSRYPNVIRILTVRDMKIPERRRTFMPFMVKSSWPSTAHSSAGSTWPGSDFLYRRPVNV